MTKTNTCNPYVCTRREGITHQMHNNECIRPAKPKTTIRAAYEYVRYGAYTVFEDLNSIKSRYPKGWAEVTQALGGEPTQIIQKVNGVRTRHTFIEVNKKGKKTQRKGWLATSLFIIRRHIDNGLEAPYNYIETSRQIASFYAGDSPLLPKRAIKLSIESRKIGLTPKIPLFGESYGRRFHMEAE